MLDAPKRAPIRVRVGATAKNRRSRRMCPTETGETLAQVTAFS
jgi:hypothetical protein